MITLYVTSFLLVMLGAAFVVADGGSFLALLGVLSCYLGGVIVGLRRD